MPHLHLSEGYQEFLVMQTAVANPRTESNQNEAERASSVSRIAILIYGITSYVIFFVTFCYAAGFIGNFIVPKSIDSPREIGVLAAVGINSALLLLFALQHSIMARPAFKLWWTRFVPAAAERSTYVLFSSLALILLFVFWQPIGGTIWHIENTIGRAVMYGFFAFGWLLVLVTTFLINHFDLFGLRQVWLHFRGRPYTHLEFKVPSLYKVVRHPLYVGWFIAFWATPTMTAAHLLFAVLTTVYILIAIQFEERDLVTHHPEYVDYKKQVPMLVPSFGRSAVPPQHAARA